MFKLSFALALALLAATPVHGGVDVLVGRYDLRGSGANLRETVLNTTNVNPGRFGKLYSYEVEGAVYAQPLIVSDLPVRGRVRNVLYVATTNNLVYALDADDPGSDGGLLWQVRLTDHGALPAPSVKTALTVQGNIGILEYAVHRSRAGHYLRCSPQPRAGRIPAATTRTRHRNGQRTAAEPGRYRAGRDRTRWTYVQF